MDKESHVHITQESNYPRNSGKCAFSFGIEREFAQKCYEIEMPEKLGECFQGVGIEIIKKIQKQTPKVIIEPPYNFFKNSSGNLTCLISSLRVPGTECGFNLETKDIEKEFEHLGHSGDYMYRIEHKKELENLSKFLEYSPHNVNRPVQSYQLFSLLFEWARDMDIWSHLLRSNF